MLELLRQKPVSVQKLEYGQQLRQRIRVHVCVCVCQLLLRHSPVKVQVAQILRWFLRGAYFLIIKDYPSMKEERKDPENCIYQTVTLMNYKINTLYLLLVLFDVADVVATHCARAHVADKSKQLVLCMTKPRP